MKVITAIVLILVILLNASGLQARQSKPQSKSEPITSITLERKGCNGPCPIDRVTFRLDGNHTYVGIKYVERLGTYKPQMKDQAFDVMVKVLERLDFFTLRGNSMRMFDAQEKIVSVTRGSDTRSVSVSGSLGEPPIEMVIITTYIEHVMSKVAWEKVSEATSPA